METGRLRAKEICHDLQFFSFCPVSKILLAFPVDSIDQQEHEYPPSSDLLGGTEGTYACSE
jgi:hypothetical protein